MINPQDAICPVCGYACLGKGGMGCIDKPSMVEPAINQPKDEYGQPPCPHCAAKDAEIAALRERVERAELLLGDWLTRPGIWEAKWVSPTAIQSAQRILRGEGE